MSLTGASTQDAMSARQAWSLIALLFAAALLWLFLAVWPEGLVAAIGTKKTFVNAIFNGVTVAGLYFLVASGFTLSARGLYRLLVRKLDGLLADRRRCGHVVHGHCRRAFANLCIPPP
jgi:hypothetical protein